MSPATDAPRSWTGTYIRVLLIEALVIWLLWLVSRHFSY